MDIIGHTLTGVLVSQVVEPRRADGPRWLWGVLGAISCTWMDADAITYLWGPDAFRQYHQIYTHNLFAFVIAPPLLALAAKKWQPDALTGGRVFVLFWVGMATHLLGDTLAQWPLKLFYPISKVGISFSLLRVDFSIVIIFIALVGAGVAYLDQLRPVRRWIAAGTLGAIALYAILGPGW